MNSKSICFISPFIAPLLDVNDTRGTGGAERQFYLFGKELAKRGWKVSYILKQEKRSKVAHWPNWCNVYIVNMNYLGGSNWNCITGLFYLLRAFLKAKSNYYVIKTPAVLIPPLLLFTKIFKRKTVFWSQMGRDADIVRKSDKHIYLKIQSYLLPRVDLIISQTENQSQNYLLNFGLKTIIVKSIAVEDAVIGELEERGYVLWVGNSLPKKRQEVFFELCKMLPHHKFVMAINASDQDRFDMARRVSSSIDNLMFLGTIKSNEMAKWFHYASIYVHTASIEGFPNTYLQAWLSAIPVVTLNIDPDGIISKNKMGYCIGEKKVHKCGEDPYQIARLLVPYVQRLLEDNELMCRMGKAGYDYVRANHSPSCVVNKLESILI